MCIFSPLSSILSMSGWSGCGVDVENERAERSGCGE